MPFGLVSRMEYLVGTYCIYCHNDPCSCSPRSLLYGKVQGMTPAEKQSEVMQRLERLSKIREELSVLKSNHRKQLEEVVAAGKYIDNRFVDIFGDISERWPSSIEVVTTRKSMSELRDEADQLIGELRDLGVDEGLLTINGK